MPTHHNCRSVGLSCYLPEGSSDDRKKGNRDLSFLREGRRSCCFSPGLQNVRSPTNPINNSSATSHPPNSNSFCNCWSLRWVFSYSRTFPPFSFISFVLV